MSRSLGSASRAPVLGVIALLAVLVVTGCGAGVKHHRHASAVTLPRCGARPAHAHRAKHAKSASLRLAAAPDGAAVTPDGHTAFVAVHDGLAVIDVAPAPRLLGTVRLPVSVSGVVVTADGRYALAAGGSGAVAVDARRARSTPAGTFVARLTAPGLSGSPGAAEVAASPDGRYAFVTLEGAGRVAVFALHPGRTGPGFSTFRGAIPVGSGALGITVSPDGRWIYEVSEAARVGAGATGALNAIQLRAAVRAPDRARVVRTSAPCSPVRVITSPDGRIIWVTARAGNALLGFSATALQRQLPRVLVSDTRVGPEPLGLTAVEDGRRILVADSGSAHPRRGRPGVSVVSAAKSGRARSHGIVPVAGQPDALAASPSSTIVLLTDAAAKRVVALAVGKLP